MPKKTKQKSLPKPEIIEIGRLKAHPKNYRQHPDDQIAHIRESIRANGVYRHVVVASDYTVLAGHGTLEACRREGYARVPVVRLAIKPDSPKALKVLAGDNEIGRLVEVDDYALSNMLKQIGELDSLLGTGFDEMQLANLVMVTRPESEIADIDEAAEWVGMPKFEVAESPWKLVVNFESEGERTKFLNNLGAKVINKSVGKTASIYWPEKEKQDLKSVRFTEAKK